MKRIEASFMEGLGEGLAEEGQDIADAEALAWAVALAHAADVDTARRHAKDAASRVKPREV
jgi:phosphoribosylglycinamide formyltransferase 2